MCGESPHEIGTLVWNDYPTLRALIKMVTSGRYRFPTIDCDEGSRSKMKEAEAKMRDEVSGTANAMSSNQPAESNQHLVMIDRNVE